jgi:hypothetical protein
VNENNNFPEKAVSWNKAKGAEKYNYLNKSEMPEGMEKKQGRTPKRGLLEKASSWNKGDVLEEEKFLLKQVDA